MSDIDIQALISYRMEKSQESIKAAELMLRNEMLTFSMNRIYYSMFYAVQALLAADNVSFSKHGQVRGYFNRELIKTGILPKSLGRLYSTTFEYRQKFDYVDFSTPDADMISEYIEKAKEFHKQIEIYLRNKI